MYTNDTAFLKQTNNNVWVFEIDGKPVKTFTNESACCIFKELLDLGWKVVNGTDIGYTLKRV